MTRPTHSLQTAEVKLRELGVEHAPIQGSLEGDGIDCRCICLCDPPGAYYLLGIDVKGKAYQNQIQLTFLHCPENAAQIAEQIGWRLDKVYSLPVVHENPPQPEFAHLTEVMAAILLPPLLKADG